MVQNLSGKPLSGAEHKALRLAIAGCGGMGHRHLYGLAELQQAGRRDFELVGVCDPVEANAASLARQAQDLLGKTPVIASKLEELAQLGVDGIDITTIPRTHHTVALEAIQRGWHVMVEKPLGVTVRACNLIRRTAEAAGCVLSVAENYRRDPMNRLARALLQTGAAGSPRFIVQHSIGGEDRMTITVWRHQKSEGGLLLDVGVHFTDMLEYLCGEIDTIYAQTRLYEPVRKNPAAGSRGAASNPAGVYERWQREMPAEFVATAEDAVYAMINFKNGATGQFIENHAARGRPVWLRQVFGSLAAMDLPPDRTGQEITLTLGGGEALRGEALLELVPDFALDPVTAQLFGGDRLAGYKFPFPEIDRKLLAVEYADFAAAIRGNQSPEVDGVQGTRSVAAVYAMLESALLGRPLTVAEVMAEQVDAYQQETNTGLGI
ncbi:MAG: Gfo/Idh/MocA family oxidoreductase [Chloroflexi bacterium]|nr:Gfo/Idh/MocA family oxidoreductase [Chloroflexota bacterium]